MFLLGLLLGPAVGLALMIFLRRWGLRSFATIAVALFVIVFLLFVPFLPVELKLGMIAGLVAGALLGLTPVEAGARVESAGLPEDV